MTRRRWIADEWSGDRALLLGDHADHLARVLRARIGQEFDIAAGGSIRRGRVISLASDRVEFELGEVILEGEPRHIAVALAIFKFDRFEWAIEKLTELGATAVLPFAARRSDAHLITAAAKRIERWRRIALAACEQSRRASPPEIAGIAKFRDVLTLPASLRIALSETASPGVSLSSLLRAHAPGGRGDLALALGPEGGWTEEELCALRESGWREASLGPNILRAETAAIAAIAVASMESSPDEC
jgi:16S rRNA (uracil1498-N3)-methyltransferase